MIGGKRAFRNPVNPHLLPWLIIVVVTAAFFVAVHEPTRSRLVQEMYQTDEATMQKNVAEGTLQRQIGFLVLGGMGVLVLLSPFRRRITLNGSLAWLVVFFLVWMMLSVAWADEPGITTRRLIVIVMFCVGSAAVAACMSVRQVVLLVFFSSMAYLLIGIAAEVLLGNFNPGGDIYRFSGTLHPNIQGINCGLLILAAITAAHTEKKNRAFYLASCAFAFAFLFLTGSRTSLFTLLGTLLVHLTIVHWRSKLAWFSASAATTAFLTVFLLGQSRFLPALEKLVLMGRTDQDLSGAKNLTGRLPLWEQLLEYASHRPIQGYGYGSFFTVERIQELSARQHWAIASCHNVFLEVLMGLGVVGVASYALIQFIALFRSLRYYRDSNDQGYVLFTSVMVMGVVSGLAESTLLVPTMQTFVQFAVIAVLALQPPPVPMVGPREDADWLRNSAKRGAQGTIARPTLTARGIVR